MRRIISIVATSIAALAFITSCQTTDPEGNGTDNGNGNNNGGGTEPPVETVDPVEEVSGTYNGVLNIDLSLMGSPATNVSENLTNEIVISAADAENTVEIQVKALSVSVAGMELDFGDRTFEACTVTDNDGSYSISGEAQMSAEVPEIFKTPVECDVTVAGTVTDGALTLTLTVSVAELPEKLTPADKVAGTYSGNMTIDLGAGASDPTPLTVEISAAEDGTVTMHTAIEGMADITLENCTVEESTEGYSIAGSGNVYVELLEQNVDVNFTGTIVDNAIALNIKVPMGFLTVTIAFEGTKDATVVTE